MAPQQRRVLTPSLFRGDLPMLPEPMEPFIRPMVFDRVRCESFLEGKRICEARFPCRSSYLLVCSRIPHYLIIRFASVTLFDSVISYSVLLSPQIRVRPAGG